MSELACRFVVLYEKSGWVIDKVVLCVQEKEEFLRVSAEMPEYEASLTLKNCRLI